MAESKEMGEQRCVTWRRTRADAWTRDWRKMKDAELDLSAAQHVEARGSRRGAQQLGSGAQAIVAGNAAVDLRAKAGAEMGATFGKQETVDSLSERASCRTRAGNARSALEIRQLLPRRSLECPGDGHLGPFSASRGTRSPPRQAARLYEVRERATTQLMG